MSGVRTFASITSKSESLGTPSAKRRTQGNCKPFLEDIGRVGRPGPRVLAADFGPVRLVGGKGNQLPIVEDRHDQRNVRKMSSAAGIRIVRNEDIAWFQVLRAEFVEHGMDREGQRSEETGHAVALRQQLAPFVGDAAAIVEHLVDDGALAGALERDEHLVADDVESVLDDLDRERVEGRWRSCLVSNGEDDIADRVDGAAHTGWHHGRGRRLLDDCRSVEACTRERDRTARRPRYRACPRCRNRPTGSLSALACPIPAPVRPATASRSEPRRRRGS